MRAVLITRSYGSGLITKVRLGRCMGRASQQRQRRERRRSQQRRLMMWWLMKRLLSDMNATVLQ